MAINTPSLDYSRRAVDWLLIRGLMSGAESARSLVRPLPGMPAEDAIEFRARAHYLPALPRTVELFGGLLFLRAPQIAAPDTMAEILADATAAGDSLAMLAAQLGEEVLSTSRAMILVDFPEANPSATVAEAAASGARVYARLYRTEDILEAKFTTTRGVRRLSRVRLAETREVEGLDYTTRVEQLVRVLEIREGVYTQELFVKGESGKWTSESRRTPQRGGVPLPYIPAFFATHRDTSPACYRPVLADLAETSAAHLNDSAAYQWGLLWTACPTPIFIGLQPPATDENGRPIGKQQAIRLGSSEGIALAPGGDAKFLEFSGSGLAAVRVAMEDKRRDMAALGARALLDDPRAAVAVETARIHRAGDHSTLAKIAGVLSEAMTAVLREMAQWVAANPEECGVEVNKNFAPSGMSPAELAALVQAWQSGAISRRDLFARLQSADVIESGKTFEEHAEEVEGDGAGIAGADGPPA